MYRMMVTCVALSLVVTGCGQAPDEPSEVVQVAPPSTWQPTEPIDMNETQKAQQELILAATNALASEMMGELSAALDSGSPDRAIGVCKTIAPEVAARVSEHFGLKIGRTSHKLRNPRNIPPDWATVFVEEVVEQPTYVVGPNGEMGAMLPIRLKAECQMCHGSPDTIDGEVLAAITDAYPEDRATGFSEGDLRGWFWVETQPGQPDHV